MKSNGDRGVVLPQSSSMLDQPKWDPLSRILEHHEVSIATSILSSVVGSLCVWLGWWDSPGVPNHKLSRCPVFISKAGVFPRIFVMIYVTGSKLIGLKCWMLSAPSFFGMRTIFVKLTFFFGLRGDQHSRCCGSYWLQLYMTSDLIVGRHFLKKIPVKPSSFGNWWEIVVVPEWYAQIICYTSQLGSDI